MFKPFPLGRGTEALFDRDRGADDLGSGAFGEVDTLDAIGGKTVIHIGWCGNIDHEKSGQMGVPQIEINGKMIVGFDQAAIDEAIASK